MAWQVALTVSQALNSPETDYRTTSIRVPIRPTTEPPSYYYPPPKLCLGLKDVFIALFLVLLILTTVIGNILVVLSVIMYKRMRTFTNILLTSLATADLLVGIFIMPLALLDLLHGHNWPFGRLLCAIWATSDVLLCTASILNLCIISLDRYLAITSPLKYTRTRSKSLAFGLLSVVWGTSIIVCTPPWFVPGWGLFHTQSAINNRNLVCMYSPSVPYRIYSALGSFYIPLLVMLSMYFKIFKVASEREKLMRQSLGTCRLSRKADAKKKNIVANTQHNRCASAPMNRNNSTQNHNNHIAKFHQSLNCKEVTSKNSQNQSPPTRHKLVKNDTIDYNSIENDGETTHYDDLGTETVSASASNHNLCIERESKSMMNLADEHPKTPPMRKNTEATVIPYTSGQLKKPQSQLFAASLMATAHVTGSFNGNPVKNRGSKEKMVYLRERKALKTIGIVVLGFIICWMPFFVIYLIEVFMVEISNTYSFRIASEFFLWLGYSNSVLNPLIYTMYNTDFRRCFRDLLTCGCLQIHSHRRTMSVRKLHQQSTIF